jgi:nitrogen-specific signal transduction histidine kinase
MISATNEVLGCLLLVGSAVDNALLVVDQSGVIHLINRAGRDLLGLSEETPGAITKAAHWRGELMEFLSRLTAEESATAVYLAGASPLVLEGYCLQRDGVPWGGLVVGRSGPGSEPLAVTPNAADLAQQIKSVLHSVLLNLYLIRKWAVSHPFIETQTLARVDAIASEVQRLDSVASSFAPQPEQRGLGRETVDLARLFDDIVESLAAEASASRVQMRWLIPKNVPPVWGDARLLKEALLALIEHCMRQRGSQTIEITGGAAPEHAFVMIRHDGGEVGPDPPEETDDSSRRVVAMAEWVVRGHGGTLETFSTPAAGGTFVLKLPAQTASR